jgi:hypothetical protein
VPDAAGPSACTAPRAQLADRHPLSEAGGPAAGVAPAGIGNHHDFNDWTDGHVAGYQPRSSL